MSDSRPIDHDARQLALDIDSSVIVQAPAGSGKTSLLTLRFLRLLSVVEVPEEIIAVTFTRKAAAEMRTRIVDALRADSASAPAELAQIAAVVRQRDVEQNWRLLDNPSRLRIQTIDALCTSLTRQLPWTSGFGAPPGLLDDFTPVYRQTVRRFLARSDDREDSIATDLRTLLLHFDNDRTSIERMLVRMLSHRDQWAQRIVGTGAGWRTQLQRVIDRLIEHRLAEVEELIDSRGGLDFAELERLLHYAASNASGNDKCPWDPARLSDCRLPLSATVKDFPIWKELAKFLLTNDGSFRKAFNVNGGFPPRGADPLAAANKKAIVDLVRGLSEIEDLDKQLNLVRRLPAEIEQDQWQLLKALQTLLPHLLAELHLSFTERGLVDYTEVALRAVSALDDADGPTELALRLDHKISHILVDEFQDTSSIQFSLIAKLTSGWQHNDGRTLFVVGDPMQSIYRFRKADVQLFLNVWQHGIGDLVLKQVSICVNFRSAAGVVDWVNASFERIFPAHSNALEGAVSYAESTAWHATDTDSAVHFHPQLARDSGAEAAQVVAIVADEIARGHRVAILVRNRNHLAHIIPALQAAGRQFQGLELVKLWDHETIQDLFALTRACQHLGDRVAWLAVLRAPWCGLLLKDLHHLIGDDKDSTVIELLRAKADQLPSADRVARVLELLEQAVLSRRRGALRDLVEWLWLEIGGPACVDSAGMDDAARYFDLLEATEDAGMVVDMSELESRLKELYASPQTGAESESLQIMTIYRSKGLEFDTVILPQLGARTRPDDAELVRLTEVATGSNRVDFLIAPRQKAGAAEDPLYALAHEFNRDRAANELDRLLYVACTRARRRLHLLGGARYDEKTDSFSPWKSSLLKRLWPVCEHHFGEQQKQPDQSTGAENTAARQLARLPALWRPPAGVEPVIERDKTDIASDEELIEYSWAGEEARQLGIVVHDVMLSLSEQGASAWTTQRVQRAKGQWRAAFRRAGASSTALDALVARTTRAVENTLQDDRGRWIVSTEHNEARSELQLTAVFDGVAQQLAIDRTFIDDDGSRWIIDYKTSRHSGGELEDFLESEKLRYVGQMTRYARAFAMLDQSHPIKLGLYFPLLRRFVCWDYTESG